MGGTTRDGSLRASARRARPFASVALAAVFAFAGLQGVERAGADPVDSVESLTPVDSVESLTSVDSVESLTSVDSAERGDPARRLIANGRCACGCGSHLPGSGRVTSCFGCSVGKAEVTFIRESLASGRSLSQILIALRELVLVEVFADYSDPRLGEVWARARRVANDLGQHRVVLRAPGFGEEARRALAVAECARGSGQFTRVQSALIAHPGPWDEASVTEVAWSVLRGAGLTASPAAESWTRESLRHCAATADLSAQIEKDRNHARAREMKSFPAVSVNRQAIPDTLESMRRAIRAAIVQGSI